MRSVEHLGYFDDLTLCRHGAFDDVQYGLNMFRVQLLGARATAFMNVNDLILKSS